MPAFDHIGDGIFVGADPGTDLAALQQSGICAVLNLQSDADLATRNRHWPDLKSTYQRLGITAYRVPILDFDDHDLARQLPVAAHMLAQIAPLYPRLYVHCNAGQQRAPAVVIAYFALYRNHSIEAAITVVSSARNCAPPLHIIRRLNQPGA